MRISAISGNALLVAMAAFALAGCATTQGVEAPAIEQAAAEPTEPATSVNPQTLPFATDIDLGDGLHMLMGTGGNLGLLVGDDGVFLIDDQYTTNAEVNLAKIEALAGDRPKYLVNTHWHYDHAGGNAVFQTSGATVFAHENVRKRMSGETQSYGGAASRSASPQEAWPVVTFTDGVDFHLNGQTIRAFKAPSAHTDGDVIVYFQEANVMHTGDTFMKGRMPFVDTGSGGSVLGILAAHDLILSVANSNTRIIPGHGELSTIEDIKEVNGYIKAAIAAVQARMAQGESLEEIVAAKTLEPWSAYMTGTLVTLETFSTVIFNELSAQE